MKNKVALIAGLIIAVVAGFSLYVSQINVLPQSSYTLFDQLPSPKVTDRVLVVSPHQDDETLGVGGYLSQAVKAGATVEVIYATDGNLHGLKATRHAEALKALQTLGVKPASVLFYNYPDGNLSAQTGFDARLKADIDQFKPTVVFTTIEYDQHPDHAATGRAVSAISAGEPGSFKAYFFLIHYHRFPRPIGEASFNKYLLPPPDLVDSKYDWFVYPLDAPTQALKLQTIKVYKTQLAYRNPILRQLLFSFEQKNELFAALR